ncbi:MAG: methionyl-tRNA formyltransferase [Bacteroidales bacterium]|jgi:methionyl-tRNA formyltransferase
MTNKKKQAEIVFMGTPGFAAGILSMLAGKGYPVKGVVTVPDKPAGRGMTARTSAVKTTALELGLPVLQPESLKDSTFLEALRQWNAPVFVVVAFRMLPRCVWEIPSRGCFNLHASLLPQYRGAAPINHVLMNGEQETGVTTFLIDDRMDTGAILLQEPVSIDPEDDAGSLHDKLMHAGGPLIAKTIDGLCTGSLKATPQPLVSKEDLKTAPKITRDTCRIDWTLDPVSISNLVRGLSPVPAAYATLKNGNVIQDVKIFRTGAEWATHQEKPGSIVTDGKKTLKVACGNGFVHILELQTPGKKRLKTPAFLAGFRNPDNAVFQ